MVKKPSQHSVNSIAVGLHRGFAVKKPTPLKPVRLNKHKALDHSREVRKLVKSLVGLTSFEKRLIEMFKVDNKKVEKRAFKILKKRLGTRSRAMKRKSEFMAIIKRAN